MIKMKYTILALLTSILLIGCTEVGSKEDKWQGWTHQAAGLVKHYDEHFGVVCYLNYREAYRGNSSSPLSCVKVN